jgi:hypothetical protein
MSENALDQLVMAVAKEVFPKAFEELVKQVDRATRAEVERDAQKARADALQAELDGLNTFAAEVDAYLATLK